MFLVLGIVGIGIGGAVGTVPFLSTDRPLHEGILVVEGWLPDYALEEAKRTFETHQYRLLVVTGVPIDQGYHVSDQKDYAQLAASTLRELGVKEESIVPVSCPEVRRDRTYATARQVKAWLDPQSSNESIDVFTLGVHARRTWLLYRLALGDGRPIGVISGSDRRYDEQGWWRSSSGFRTVTGEVLAFGYAKFLFQPE